MHAVIKKILPAYDHKLQVMEIQTILCSDRSRAQVRDVRARGLVCRESTWKSRRVPALAGFPKRDGAEVPTGEQFRQVLEHIRPTMGGWLQEFLCELDKFA